MPTPRDTYDELMDYLGNLAVIDTHEHLPHREEARDAGQDVLGEYLSHYMSSDLRSAGLSQAKLDFIRDPGKPLMDRWLAVEPYWEACRYTGYGRALDISAKGIYGLDGVRRDTISELAMVHKEAMTPGHYKRVLKDLCHIEVSILDGFPPLIPDRDPVFFKRVWQATQFLAPWYPMGEFMDRLETLYGLRVRTMEDWLDGFDLELEEMVGKHGAVALKCPLAYERTIRFEKRDYPEAKGSFDSALAGWASEGTAPGGDFRIPPEAQDYIMHHIMKRANERGMVFQFHTGLLESNGNTLGNSDPMHLNNLFLEYPEVKFDIFHIGYPFQNTVAALAKMFPNVYIDMCWAHIISASASRTALHDFLDAVPYIKISAFGGDYLFPDGVYGHLSIAKDNVARVLAEKASEGQWDISEAKVIAKALFYDNPKNLFKV